MQVANKGVVQLRKLGGLDKIKVGKTGSLLNPKIFRAERKLGVNESGELEGDYKGRTIINSKTFIAPQWDDLKKQWAWGGNEQDLSRLIKNMRLKYPKNHLKEGQDIKPGKEGEDVNRLVNFYDEVFRHPFFYGKYFMSNGRINLQLSDPIQEFLYLCYLGASNTLDRSSKEKPNKYIAAGARNEIVSPKKEVRDRKQDAEREMEALNLLWAMKDDEDRMRAIAEIMDLPQYSPQTETSGVFLLLKETAAENTAHSSRYGKSYQSRFVELANENDRDLLVSHEIVKAKQKGFLRRRQNGFDFNGKLLTGIDSIPRLIKYFKDTANQEDYLQLSDLLKLEDV